MSGLEILGLAAAAAVAGGMNAVAGGGTLVTFPVLILFGTASITANATSTLALFIGTIGSVYSYRRQLETVKPWLRRFIPVSLIGGLIGSILLTRTDEKAFAKLVPFLLLFATFIFLLQGVFRRFAGFGERGKQVAEPQSPHRLIGMAILFQFAVAVYGGYFGAGIGILMLASLGFLGLTNIHEMNALKTVLAAVINGIAAAYFIFAGLIDWPRMWVMVVGALMGYFLGAHYAQRISQKRVRQIITGIGFVISGVLFYKQFR